MTPDNRLPRISQPPRDYGRNVTTPAPFVDRWNTAPAAPKAHSAAPDYRRTSEPQHQQPVTPQHAPEDISHQRHMSIAEEPRHSISATSPFASSPSPRNPSITPPPPNAKSTPPPRRTTSSTRAAPPPPSAPRLMRAPINPPPKSATPTPTTPTPPTTQVTPPDPEAPEAAKQP